MHGYLATRLSNTLQCASTTKESKAVCESHSRGTDGQGFPHMICHVGAGSKSEAKSMMAAAGVPVVPGYHGADQSEDR